MLSAPYWESQAHDCQTGSVTAVVTSFDDSYLLSAAQDGTLYIHVSLSCICPGMTGFSCCLTCVHLLWLLDLCIALGQQAALWPLCELLATNQTSGTVIGRKCVLIVLMHEQKQLTSLQRHVVSKPC